MRLSDLGSPGGAARFALAPTPPVAPSGGNAQAAAGSGEGAFPELAHVGCLPGGMGLLGDSFHGRSRFPLRARRANG